MQIVDETLMMHGREWNGEEDLAGWLISEKFNGCRAFWDGSRLWTRAGNLIRIPPAWASQLPAARLDCELWAGRDGFEIARVACQYGRFTPAVRLMVFDADEAGNFAQRLHSVQRLVAGLHFAKAVPCRICPSTAVAVSKMLKIQAEGGEGLIARHPGNVYEAGRTRTVLKLKDYYPPQRALAAPRSDQRVSTSHRLAMQCSASF